MWRLSYTNSGKRSHTVERLHKQITIFGDFQSSNLGPKHLDAESFQDAHLVELDSDIQSTLSTESQQDAVWSFFL